METNKNLEFVKNDSQVMHQLSERSAPRRNDRSITSYHAHAVSMNLIRILKEINGNPAEVASRDIFGPSRGNKVAKLMRRTVKEMKISVQNFTQFFQKGFLGFELQLSRGGWSKEGSDCVDILLFPRGKSSLRNTTKRSFLTNVRQSLPKVGACACGDCI